MGVWELIQDQILGMKWLNELIGRGLSLLGLDVGGRVGGSIQFFLYDVLKITVLLCLLIFVISYIQSYFPPERSRRILGRFHGVGANVISALLGTVTPFCSCSSIPLFIGFTSAGLPLGVTFSFLISSPMVDLGSLILLMSIFGAKVAVVYVSVGLAIAVAGGTLIERLHMEPYVEDFIRKAGKVDIDSPGLSRRERVQFAREQVGSTFRKVFPYILAGVGIGAVIHNWIPENYDFRNRFWLACRDAYSHTASMAALRSHGMKANKEAVYKLLYLSHSEFYAVNLISCPFLAGKIKSDVT